MSQNLKCIFIIGSLIFLFGCGGTGSQNSTTANGFKYIHHVKNGSATPLVDEYAYYHLYIRNPETNKLSYNSRDQEQIQRSAIVDPELLKNKDPQPILDALTLMSVGDSLTVFKSLVDMARKPTGYENAQSIAYDIKMVEIKTAEQYKQEYLDRKAAIEAKQQAIKDRESVVGEMTRNNAIAYMKGELDDQIQTTASGLKYIIHEEGTGPKPKSSQTVHAHYYGTLNTGAMFDNSFRKGSNFKFQINRGQVIPGWDEGFSLLNEGSKATLFVPSKLGYGATARGERIPANSELIFYVELEKVE